MASRFLSALGRSRDRITGALAALVPGKRVDEETLEDLEAGLLGADVGPRLAMRLIDSVRDAPAEAVRSALRDEMVSVFDDLPQRAEIVASPRVVLVVGVNGSGKTTTVAKLARRWQGEGERVLLAAADTFRAAAVDQLREWAQRLDVEIVAQADGGDPAAVAFDACEAGVARGVDTVLVDTAGRLHTHDNLMAELEKISRVTAKVIPGSPHEVLLVLDGTTGQNGLRQAAEFLDSSGVTGVVLSKLDGTARGGVALTIADELSLPIRFVGVGEQADDLAEFDASEYVDGLLGTDST